MSPTVTVYLFDSFSCLVSMSNCADAGNALIDVIATHRCKRRDILIRVPDGVTANWPMIILRYENNRKDRDRLLAAFEAKL